MFGHAAGKLMFFDGDVCYNIRAASITISRETETLEATGFPFEPGIQQVLDSATASETFNLEVTFQSFDQVALGYTLDTKQETLDSISVPTVNKYTVGASVANQVAIVGLTQDQDVQVQIIDDSSEQQLTQKAYTAGTPSDGEFEVDAGVIHFNSAQNGATVAVIHFTTETSLANAYGGNGTGAAFGEQKFYGLLKGTRGDQEIYIPRIKLASNFELSLGGDVAEGTVAGQMLTPTAWTRPYLLFPAR